MEATKILVDLTLLLDEVEFELSLRNPLFEDIGGDEYDEI